MGMKSILFSNVLFIAMKQLFENVHSLNPSFVYMTDDEKFAYLFRSNDERIGTVNYSQKHGSRAGEASKTTGSGYRNALAAGCSLLTALYIRT